MKFFRSISAKILVPVIVITILLVSVPVMVGMYTFSKFSEAILAKEIKIFSNSLTQEVENQKSTALDQTDAVAASARLVAAIKDENWERIRDVIMSYKAEKSSDFFTLLDTEGNVIFRSNQPERRPSPPGTDSMANLRGAREVLTRKKGGVFFESTPSIRMAIRASVPIYDGETFIGIMMGGFRLDSDKWVDHVREIYGVECTIFSGETRVATTVRKAGTDEEERAVDTELNNPEIYKKVFDEKETFYGKATVVGQPMKAFYMPLHNEGDEKPVGIFFIGVPLQSQIDLERQSMWTNVIATIIGLLVCVAILYWIIRSIVVPIRSTASFARHIAETGDMTHEVPREYLDRKDEVGELAHGIEVMLTEFQNVATLAQTLAGGDWRNDIKIRGDLDTMNKDLTTMLGQVNNALHEIDDNVKQVATGSSEVSSAAQSLANGAQEAAASLEEISASMSEVSGQTKKNAESAGQARDLAHKASKAATEGQGAMQEMTEAMGRITQNSSEIQRVIKVIDDIAFQTNLLALNAAVEAARAGQHGKGFAVVAEEVRNLAARSAKAAKETSELIAKSGYEIEKGGEVASRTANVLNTIVEQIKQTTDIIAGIAVASDEQAQGVNQITIGLQQIDSVTQQNTASAEESASAANEMSSMATNLQKLVAQFKLR